MTAEHVAALLQIRVLVGKIEALAGGTPMRSCAPFTGADVDVFCAEIEQAISEIRAYRAHLEEDVT